MLGLLVNAVFFSVVLLIVNISLFNVYKNIYIQKLIFFHKKMDISNLKSFSLRGKKFQVSIAFNNHPIPIIREQFLENYEYYMAVTKFRSRKDITKKINITLVAILITSLVVGYSL